MTPLMRRYPSPSLIVSITALVVALGGASYSATGGNFILGRSNTATTQTSLTAHLNGPTLKLWNSNTGGAAAPLALFAAAGHPPFKVNSATKVSFLNADRLDGLDSAQFPRRLVISYNLASGATSAPIALFPDRPVFVMGVANTAPERSVGQATLLRAPGASIIWTGLESLAYNAVSTVTSGYGSATGSHIVFLDYSHLVDIEVSGPDAIRIHNESAQTQTGKVTLMW